MFGGLLIKDPGKVTWDFCSFTRTGWSQPGNVAIQKHHGGTSAAVLARIFKENVFKSYWVLD